jgi:hypothetical protein
LASATEKRRSNLSTKAALPVIYEIREIVHRETP